MVILLNADNIAVSSSGTTSGSAAAISVDSTKFSKNLSISDINVQHALETLDQLTAGNGSGTVTSVQTVLPDVNGNVDLTNVFVNTSNVASSVAQGNNNPVSSNAVYTSLLSKVDAVYGKVLSTNDYTNTDKSIVSGLSLFNPNTKVDKEDGKYLFSGSYNDLSDKPAFQAQLGYTPENIANKGVANGYVPTNSANKVDAQYLPSYVDDFLEFDTFNDFPVTGDSGIVYLDLAENKQYRWSGSQYSIIAQSPGSSDSVIEGSTNLYFTEARVLSTVLSGINTSTIAVISNTDTVLTAIGKLQAQLSNKVDVVSGKVLSDQNYTIEEKNKLATLVYVDISSLQTQIDNKVDKVIGKDLFSGSYADLTNKPIVDSVVTQDSTHLITSGAVYTAVSNVSGGGGGGGTALSTTVDTTNFSKNLSALDVNVQTALETIDQFDFQSTYEIASQAEAEAGTENTKVMTALRVFQSVISNVVNYSFSLNTISKTLVGAINELFLNKAAKIAMPATTKLLKSDSEGNPVESNLLESAIVTTQQINVSDIQIGESKLLAATKQADGTAAFTGAVNTLDKLVSSVWDTLLADTAAWVGDVLDLTGNNLNGGLGQNGQEHQINGNFYLCISHVIGTTTSNGSARWVRNRSNDCLTTNTQDTAIVTLLQTESGWDAVTNTKIITTRSKVGSWYTTSTGYHYFCFAESGSTWYWRRIGQPSSSPMQITDATLIAEIVAHDFTTTPYFSPVATVKGEQGQEYCWIANSTANMARCGLFSGSLYWFKVK